MNNLRSLLALLLLVPVLSCSDDSVAPPRDAAPEGVVAPDGAGLVEAGGRELGPPPDASQPETGPREGGAEAGRPDGGATTSCGNLTCQAATQVCVEKTPVGPGISFTCQPVPAGCENDRSCACLKSTLCVGAFNVCSEPNTPNTIRCECPNCQ